MVIYSVKPAFQKMLKPLESFFIRNKVHPTTINFMALFIAILGGLALYFSDKQVLLLIYIPFMAFFRMALNALDGMVARSLKVKNQAFGEVLNEFIDRISDAFTFFAWAMTSYVDLILGSITVILILLNSYLSIVSKAAGGKRQYGGLMGKADRMFVLSAGCVLLLVIQDFRFGNWTMAVIAIGMIITMVQRFVTIKKELYT
jgi:CDP-diacylglycerol--glycerol-3-phosphate 3-phosphatidyltransferase